MRTLAEVFLVEKKKEQKKEKPSGRKPRKKADVAELEEFISQVQRLKDLLEKKREYERIHKALKSGKHGQTRVVEIMREHFSNAFRDVGDAYDETLEPVLRLEKVAVRMKSKERKRADSARILTILKEQATPAIQKAIAKAEALAKEDPTRSFYEEWELIDIAESYGQGGKLLSEGIMDWLRAKGKKMLGKLKNTTSWFRSKAAPILSSIATELESIEITFPPVSDFLASEFKTVGPEKEEREEGSLKSYKHYP